MANLKDLVDIELIRKDDFCGTRYGKDNQLEVIWHNGLVGNNRKYIVRCDVCSPDTELHGEGYFLMYKGHIDRNCAPCGCSTKCNWTQDQYKIRANRAAQHKGVEFIGWKDDLFINSNKTMALLLCEDHGVYPVALSFLLDLEKPKGCAGCFAIRIGNFKRKDDSEMIEKFLATGCYHPDTKFYRSERLDKHGHAKYWYMDCPECGETAEGHLVGLYKGARSCSCSNSRQKQAYINFVKDGDLVVALKYGIATLYINRIAQQNNKSIYDIENYGVWEFPEVMKCKGAERTCSTSLVRGVIPKEEMPDGHTETTLTTNLEKIIEIYEEYGGIRVV